MNNVIKIELYDSLDGTYLTTINVPDDLPYVPNTGDMLRTNDDRYIVYKKVFDIGCQPNLIKLYIEKYRCFNTVYDN